MHSKIIVNLILRIKKRKDYIYLRIRPITIGQPYFF